ncbi:hypothetical protein [Acrocarpospora catenulata]|uniref:hypothetical protein n=1 Tax=Acrocarpospora catenulata TaxID=2836182 RepID=UPI001BDAC4C5|nr:hypothetical protein [Acrocarpospora catenulata]
MADPLYCANEDHVRPAVARLSWPCGRFNPTLACREDAARSLRESIADGYTLLVEPIEIRERPKGPRDYAPAVREVARLYRKSYGEPVRAILLAAPDLLSYDELPETLEERRALPARFHTPVWLDTCTPKVWVCAVCWDEGQTYGWPCKTAVEQGGEVFAR